MPDKQTYDVGRLPKKIRLSGHQIPVDFAIGSGWSDYDEPKQDESAWLAAARKGAADYLTFETRDAVWNHQL